MVVLLGLAASIATFVGGLFALKFKDKLHLVLGFSAGAIIGVAILDLLPEALKISSGAYESDFIFFLVALAFLIYLSMDRAFFLRFCQGENCKNPEHRGGLGATTLSLHSFLDGVAIALGFQTSVIIGFTVTIAVMSHKFSDGINTVGLVLKNSGNVKRALKWLAIASIAPLLGALSASVIILPENLLSLALAVFSGFFLYIGASDLLPESHHSHPTKWTTVMTILGTLAMYGIIRLAE